ncbi:MAG: HAD-IA family hydrolase [Siculibacillus sp.]
MGPKVLIFDVDGTLAETEEIHRAAFDRAFAEDGLDWRWDVDLYRALLRVTGGKERIRARADALGLDRAALPDERIARLHARKTEIYGATVRAGGCVLRPGVEALIRSAHAVGRRLAVVTTTSRPNVEALLAATLGADGPALFAVTICGEDVAAKKPAPDAYLLALERLGVAAAECLAFEDSWNGLTAARAAGLATIVTPSLYTEGEDFTGAARVLPDLVGFDPDRPLD